MRANVALGSLPVVTFAGRFGARYGDPLARQTPFRMDFCILGPLEARDQGRTVRVGGSKQRALLAVLLLHANEPLSIDRLVDELWGESPPVKAAQNLRVYISRLRRAFEDADCGNAADMIV